MRTLIAISIIASAVSLPASAMLMRPQSDTATALHAIPVADGCGSGSYRDPAFQSCRTDFFREIPDESRHDLTSRRQHREWPHRDDGASW